MSHEARPQDISGVTHDGCSVTIADFQAPAPLPPLVLPSGFTTARLYWDLPLIHGSQFIRVLDLDKPSPLNSPDSPLTGQLTVKDLKTSPKFTALSYVWGDPPKGDYTINCNGCSVSITRNCHEALSSIRKEHGDVTIWVDAICINQDDEQERAFQITLMGEIYTWAQTVYVWLGPGQDATAAPAVQEIKRLSSQRSTIPGVPWSTGVAGLSTSAEKHALYRRVLKLYIVSVLRVTVAATRDICRIILRWYCTRVGCHTGAGESDVGDVEDNSTTLKHFYNDMSNLEWLHRSWTFQELMLASNPVLICGQHFVTWTQLRVGSAPRWASDRPYSIRWTLPSASLMIQDSSGVWGSLFAAWDRLNRPTAWNGVEFRHLDLMEPRDVYKNGIWSVSKYQECFFDQRVVFTKVVRFWSFLLGLTFVSVVSSGGMAGGLMVLSTIAVFGPQIMSVLLDLWNLDINPRWMPGMFLWPTTEHGDFVKAIIQALRERQSSKASDRAYSLDGVLRRYGVILPSPDYSLSSGQVYRQYFQALVEWRPALTNLLIDIGPQQPDVPSWVPDWSAANERAWLDSGYLYSHLTERTNPEAGAQFDAGIMTLCGALLGTVHFCTGPFQPSDTNASMFENFAKLYRWLALVKAETPIHSNHTLPSAILELLFARTKHGAFGFDGNSEQALLNSFHNWYRVVSDYLQPEWHRHGLGHTPPSEMVDRLEQGQDASQFVRLLCEHFAGKRGLLFSRDGYMGCGPPHMAAGDELAILRGVAVPMILREQPRGQDAESESEGLIRYRVVGPAFLHGLMTEDERNMCMAGRAWTSISLV